MVNPLFKPSIVPKAFTTEQVLLVNTAQSLPTAMATSLTALSSILNVSTSGNVSFGEQFTVQSFLVNPTPEATQQPPFLSPFEKSVISQVYDHLSTLPFQLKVTFSAIFGSCLVAGTLLNCVAVCAIKQSGQYRNNSTFLIMLLSANDAAKSLFNNVLYIIFLWFFQDISFQTGVLLKTVSHLFAYTSSMLVCAIGFDRYMRVVYTTCYSNVVTVRRYRAFLVVIYALVVVQTALNLVGPLWMGEGYGGLFTAPINVALLVMTAILYFDCIRRLRAYERESRKISAESQSLIYMAAVYVGLFGFFHLPPVVYTVCYKAVFVANGVSDRLVALLTCLVFLCINGNGITNAAVFLATNRRLRRPRGLEVISIPLRSFSVQSPRADARCKPGGSA